MTRQRRIARSALIAAGAVVALTGAAQTSPRTGERIVTVTGCLKAWDRVTGGATTATPGLAPVAPGATFLLTSVERPSTSPSTDAAAATLPGGQYLVRAANSTLDLSLHLNHKVRVTGSLEPPASPDAAPGAAAVARDTLAVTTLTMVGATCPSAGN